MDHLDEPFERRDRVREARVDGEQFADHGLARQRDAHPHACAREVEHRARADLGDEIGRSDLGAGREIEGNGHALARAALRMNQRMRQADAVSAAVKPDVLSGPARDHLGLAAVEAARRRDGDGDLVAGHDVLEPFAVGLMPADHEIIAVDRIEHAAIGVGTHGTRVARQSNDGAARGGGLGELTNREFLGFSFTKQGREIFEPDAHGKGIGVSRARLERDPGHHASWPAPTCAAAARACARARGSHGRARGAPRGTARRG